MIEGYFKTNSGKGLYCKVLETKDKYEIWSNLKLSDSYKFTLSNITTGKKILGNAIVFRKAYSLWTQVLSGYSAEALVRFDFTKDEIITSEMSKSGIGATQHTNNENDFVYLGSVIKK